MANYYGITRTNYFSVKDPEEFEKLTAKIVDDEGEHAHMITKHCDGVEKYGFYTNGAMLGIEPEGIDEDDENYGFDQYDVAMAIQKMLPKNDACIITEVGHEKARYLIGYAYVVTADDIKFISLENTAIQTACEMLCDDSWTTCNEY